MNLERNYGFYSSRGYCYTDLNGNKGYISELAPIFFIPYLNANQRKLWIESFKNFTETLKELKEKLEN